jgi:hypothetical protein
MYLYTITAEKEFEKSMPRKNNTPKHHSFRSVNNCDTKRRYKTEKEALAAADYQMLVNQNLELSVYKCELCGGWHLTRGESKSRYTQV